MKLEKDKIDKTWYLHFNKNCFMHLQNDWSQLFGKFNWYSFHIIYIYFEKCTMTQAYEFEFILLGVGFWIRYNYSYEWEKKYDKEINKIKNK